MSDAHLDKVRRVDTAPTTVIVNRELEAAGYELKASTMGRFIITKKGFRKVLQGHRALVVFVDGLRIARGAEPIIKVGA